MPPYQPRSVAADFADAQIRDARYQYPTLHFHTGCPSCGQNTPCGSCRYEYASPSGTVFSGALLLHHQLLKSVFSAQLAQQLRLRKFSGKRINFACFYRQHETLRRSGLHQRRQNSRSISNATCSTAYQTLSESTSSCLSQYLLTLPCVKCLNRSAPKACHQLAPAPASSPIS